MAGFFLITTFLRRTLYIFLALLVLAAFIGIFAFINADKLIDRFIQNQSFEIRMDLLEGEDMKLVTVGTSSPLPSDRVQSCNAVIVNGKFFIFDIGQGAASKIEQLHLPMARVSAVFISHWHTDHFLDLPHLMNRSWQMGRNYSLPVYGPPPVDSILENISGLLVEDWKVREAHHGIEFMDPSIAGAVPYLIDIGTTGSTVVYNNDGIKITAFAVDHHPVNPSLGFRIEYQGKVLVISGDTKKSESLIQYAHDADILVHEAMQKDFIARARVIQENNGRTRFSKILEDILEYHSSPEDAATVAQAAGVKKLILSHLAPPPENPISRRFYTRGLSDIYKGPILLAEDGDIFIIK